jgi:hypothetical protein
VRAMGAAVTICAVVAIAEPAMGGTYDVWGCRLPDGRPAPTAGWQPVSVTAPPPWVDCEARRGMRAEFSPTALGPGSVVGWQFVPPPGTTIGSYELYRSARASRGADGTDRAYALYHNEPRFDPLVTMFEYCTPFAGCTSQGDAVGDDPMDPDNAVARGPLRATRLILRMECRVPGGSGGCGPADPPGALRIGRARIGITDDVGPTIQPPSGPLVMPRALLDGAQAVTVSASDVGGGVASFAVLVDGNTVADETLHDRFPSCRAPYVDLVPCPGETVHSFAFDSAAVPNGQHALQIAALDAAGNRAVSAPVEVHVVNGTLPNGVGATRRAKLAARFRQGGRRKTVGFRRTLPLRGRLTGPRGRPIANARIDVMATNIRPGAKTRREAIVETRKDGRFRYVPVRGPSRRIQLTYRAFTLDPEPSATAGLKLNVRAGVRLDVRPRRTSSNGLIRFDGRLVGGPGRDGVQVALYAVARRGRNRVPVAVLRTDRAGRFRFRYRFTRTFAPFTYRFQARLEHQRDYPYASAGSRRVTVRVVR